MAFKAQPSVSLMFLPNFNNYSVIYHGTDPQQDRINQFYVIKEQNFVNGDVIYVSVLQQIISMNQSNCVYNSANQSI